MPVLRIRQVSLVEFSSMVMPIPARIILNIPGKDQAARSARKNIREPILNNLLSMLLPEFLRAMLARLLISTDDCRVRENVILHCGFYRWFGWLTYVIQHGIQRVELVKVAVAPDGWARPPITSVFPVVDSLNCTCR